MPKEPTGWIPLHNAYGFGTLSGWIPDDYDHNDRLLGDLYGMQRLDMKDVYQTIFEKAEERTKVNLEESCPPVYDQHALGSCVANATAAALRFAWQNCFANISKPYDTFDPSRLWIYYYARLLNNRRQDLEFRDTGCNIRDALKVLKNKGVCTEQAWQYLSEAESDAVAQLQHDTGDGDAMPHNCRAGIVPETAKTESAAQFFDFGFDYYRIQNLSNGEEGTTIAVDTIIKQMCACLAEGFPIIFGFATYYEADNETREFSNPKNWTGDVLNVDKLKDRGKKSGSHAVLCVGFDSNRKLFRIMNSWGSDWKGKGYFWMPFSWFERTGTLYNLWTIRPHHAPLLRDHDPIE